ncbi:MAG: DUF2155 domain-containing protein [Octadecabacter sp.]|nr:DUF2155 domain-containing protein [Octadecabacter sp.]
MKAVITALLIMSALPVAAQQATTGTGGTLRVLDKVTGRTQDLEFTNGQTRSVGLLAITMTECRFPTGNRSGDAYALLTIVYNNAVDPVFRGWMIASAPALNALDHPRYDVWALRCSSE